jgi:class 3 adenylate cyclase
MPEREDIKQAIDRLETERENLGDSTVDAALAGLYRRLEELDESEIEVGTDEVKSGHTGERRVVTVLFCDVTGSTALAESMDPEAWTGIMNAAFEYLIEPIERYGGTVARLMGDAILAFFGAPTAHEDDPQRAVLAGLGIVEMLAQKLQANTRPWAMRSIWLPGWSRPPRRVRCRSRKTLIHWSHHCLNSRS